MSLFMVDFYQAPKEEIKRSADIVELIGQYVQLKKAGLNHVGLCPFHGDNDPSFTVSQGKQIFHCFGCKKGGDIFTFWMEYHKVSYPQTIKELAEKYHVALPEKKVTQGKRRKLDNREEIYRINGAAAAYYNYILLKIAKGRKGIEYFEKRSVGPEIINRFKLGYAPQDWDGLTRFLSDRNVSLEKAEKAGLLSPKKNGGYFDRFRERVMFPIFTMEGKVAGFGGRVLDKSMPKYLNTPETSVFHKGELLYGLNTAFPHIRETGRVVIVEGYTDVLALNKHGFSAVVATLGTALTQNHLRKLKGFSREIIVVFDADSAGKNAAVRSLPLFLNEGLSAKVMILPEGDDPDTFMNNRGLDAFLSHLDRAIPLYDFYIDSKLASVKPGLTGKVEILKEIIPVLSEITSDIQRSVYIKHLSERCDVSETVILSELNRIRGTASGRGSFSGLESVQNGAGVKSLKEYHLLNLVIHSPGIAGKVLLDDFKVLISTNEVVKIFNILVEEYRLKKCIDPAQILENMQEGEEREIFNGLMLSEPIYKGPAIEQAVLEFENRIKDIKLANSI
ncbi:MAG: DNA primase, partial [Deltaproteobacteria bacterium]|nr:DNA primase [Deltaproteobacteria bacterium]